MLIYTIHLDWLHTLTDELGSFSNTHWSSSKSTCFCFQCNIYILITEYNLKSAFSINGYSLLVASQSKQLYINIFFLW